jgi:hypothetical protein
MYRHLLSAAILVAVMAFGLTSSGPFAKATTPSTANWFSWRLDTSGPSVKNNTGWYIDDALWAWNYASRMSPYEVSLGPDFYLDTAYEVSGYWAWVEYVRRGVTVCGGRSYGDTGNCNYTTQKGEWGQIYFNTYYSLSQVEKTWLVMHELGHVFGLQHHSGTLMNDTYTSYWDMSHVDYHLGAHY